MNFPCPNPYAMSQMTPVMGNGMGTNPFAKSQMTPVMGNGMGTNPFAMSQMTPSFATSGMGMKPLEYSGMIPFDGRGNSNFMNGNNNCNINCYHKYYNGRSEEVDED